MMSATTGTLLPPRRLRLASVLVVLAAAIASGIVAFVIVSAVTARPATHPHRDAGAGSAVAAAAGLPPIDARGGPGAASTDPSLDAAAPTSTPVDAAAPIDAGIPDAPDPGASGGQPVHAGADRRSGTLEVVARPALSVTIDGRRYGDTPLTTRLAPGKHRVVLRNVENKSNEVLPAVIINENQTTSIDRMHQ
jgi:hypothetical protein